MDSIKNDFYKKEDAEYVQIKILKEDINSLSI